MTLDEFKEFTKNMPGDRQIMYHSYYSFNMTSKSKYFKKGCCLSPYEFDEIWIKEDDNVLVINPGNDYDNRKSIND